MFPLVDVYEACKEVTETAPRVYTLQEMAIAMHISETGEKYSELNLDAPQFQVGDVQPPFRYDAEKPEDDIDPLPVRI